MVDEREHPEHKEWFAVRTKPQQERNAVLHYRRQGFTVYSPMVQTTIRHARKVEKVLRPLFPGYLFLHLGPAERNWTTIASTRGALGPVQFGEHYPSVPEAVMAAIRDRETTAGYISLADAEGSRLKPGCRVAVTLGGEEVEGIFQQFKGEDRAVLLLDILQRQTKMVAPLCDVKAA